VLLWTNKQTQSGTVSKLLYNDNGTGDMYNLRGSVVKTKYLVQ